MSVNERRGSVASSEASLVDPTVVAKILPKKDAVAAKIKIKKPGVKPKLKESESIDNLPDGTPRSPSPDSPLINEIDAELRKSFPTGRPMEDKADMIQCKHCKKPMLTSVAASHIKMCLQKKQDRAQKKKENKEIARKLREAQAKGEDKDGDANMEDSVTVGKREPADGDTGNDSINGGSSSQPPSKNAKKSAVKATTDENGNKKAASSKKRKAGDPADGPDSEPKKKKTKKELEAAKPKAPKPKGPVDVEKQCGVALANGAFCARSLTCKSHSMGAKRAVPGRSLPYDMLLAAYQKKNQAKQQKAAIDANAPLPDEIDMTQGPIDSDEEKDLVMAAIARSRPRPLEQHIFVPVRRKYAYVRIKEMLGQALSGGNRGTMGGMGVGGMFSAQTLMSGGLAGGADAGGEGVERRDSAATRPGTSAGGASRKASVVA
ncbi:MAG: Dcp1p-Dcp2p decapping enzyme complex alpha subunit [Icmadophila ericetorum]|nr:Dcp1p-Dcp2p decapping enzyme complex alpha subunit [Icmadophila ericetorum]